MHQPQKTERCFDQKNVVCLLMWTHWTERTCVDGWGSLFTNYRKICRCAHIGPGIFAITVIPTVSDIEIEIAYLFHSHRKPPHIHHVRNHRVAIRVHRDKWRIIIAYCLLHRSFSSALVQTNLELFRMRRHRF